MNNQTIDTITFPYCSAVSLGGLNLREQVR
jgi:hypothetical protein